MMHNSGNLYRLLFLVAMIAWGIQPALGQQKDLQTRVDDLRQVQQKYALDPGSSWLSRVSITPTDILQKFRDAGMSPTEHVLSKVETDLVAKAFAALPPLHQRVLRQHLKSISFLDNMPNTALTSPITEEREVNLYHITFRAGILHQTISEWATEKERTCFAGGDSSISIEVEAGSMTALTYVLLHEGTHVVDGSIRLISADTVAGKPQQNEFTAGFSHGIWKDINTFAWTFKDSLAGKSRFRRDGSPFAPADALNVYSSLSLSPFASLYSTASWHEDLAELLTIYHLTQRLGQPYRVVVRQHGRLRYQYEPGKNYLVRRRTRQLARFYTILSARE